MSRRIRWALGCALVVVSLGAVLYGYLRTAAWLRVLRNMQVFLDPDPHPYRPTPWGGSVGGGTGLSGAGPQRALGQPEGAVPAEQ